MTPSLLPGDQATPRPVMTVRGPVPHDALGITDAHNHVWIGRVAGAPAGSLVLDRFDAILRELGEYRNAGGGALLDCQPGGCGRDGNKLADLADRSQVHIVASTGFHLKKYYPGGYKLWKANAATVADLLVSELTDCLEETRSASTPVKAGFIKIALEAAWTDCPREALEGAAAAAARTGALIEIHTEKGALAERACVYFTDAGLAPHQLVLCHMDKRPDLALHTALAGFGVLLEYDTFHRPKYKPASNLWPLLDAMAAAGFADRVALATDMAEGEHYRNIGGGPGLASLPGEISRELRERGFTKLQQDQLLGGNIARRLAGLN